MNRAFPPGESAGGRGIPQTSPVHDRVAEDRLKGLGMPSNAYTVNYYDTSDTMTWIMVFEAETAEEAYALAEENRLTNAICPEETEIYSIANNKTGKDVYLSGRAGGSGFIPE
jgi:hypothetical protein